MNVWDGVFISATVFVLYNIIVKLSRDYYAPPVFYAYLGNFLVTATSQLAGAYSLIYVSQYTLSLTANYFTTYGNKTAIGDYLGLW